MEPKYYIASINANCKVDIEEVTICNKYETWSLVKIGNRPKESFTNKEIDTRVRSTEYDAAICLLYSKTREVMESSDTHKLKINQYNTIAKKLIEL